MAVDPASHTMVDPATNHCGICSWTNLKTSDTIIVYIITFVITLWENADTLSDFRPGNIRELKRPQRQRQQKRHLKIEFGRFQTLALFSISFNLSSVEEFFWSWILTDCTKVLRNKRRENCRLVSTPAIKREHDYETSRCSRAIDKSMMHVQICCFVFRRSCCCRRCLSSLLNSLSGQENLSLRNSSQIYQIADAVIAAFADLFSSAIIVFTWHCVRNEATVGKLPW